jgi:hypothetical protein
MLTDIACSFTDIPENGRTVVKRSGMLWQSKNQALQAVCGHFRPEVYLQNRAKCCDIAIDYILDVR